MTVGAKIATVVAVRALGGAVQSKFADDPGRVRQLLGYSTGKGKKRAPAPPLLATPAAG